MSIAPITHLHPTDAILQAIGDEIEAHRALIDGPTRPHRLELIVKLDEHTGRVAYIEFRASRSRDPRRRQA